MFTVKKLFLIDGVGATVSAIMLGFILPQFRDLIGMPLTELFLLATIPVFFMVYDLICYLFKAENGKLLRMIAFANLGYCMLSAAFAINNSAELTTLGWVYFSGEILIILVLVAIELKTARSAIKASKG